MVRVIFLVHLKRVGFGIGSELAAWKEEMRKAAAAIMQPQAPWAKGSQAKPQLGTHTASLNHFIFSCSGAASGQSTLSSRIKCPQELCTPLSTIQGQNLASSKQAAAKQCPGAPKAPERSQGKAQPLQRAAEPRCTAVDNRRGSRQKGSSALLSVSETFALVRAWRQRHGA